ncbi:MAG: hypothetical protein WDO71_22230 [Bacteroidota bacterium]
MGSATIIEKIEIKWPVSNTIQVFKNIQPGQTIKIKEGSAVLQTILRKKTNFTETRSGLISCSPE